MSDIQFVEINAESIQEDLINEFETAAGETLYPGDERRIFLQQEVPVIVGLKNDINDTGRQNLLRYARDEVLDALGEFAGVSRLPAQKATTTLRWTLSAVQENPITVPAGTRATPDGELYFITTEALVIAAGQSYGDVLAEATDTGIKHNNFTAGQIKNIVDPIAFVQSVSNTTTSAGGTDIESDDDYRARIRLAPESYSTAGSIGGYEFWARSADITISDIAVITPSAGVVKIVVLLDNGVIPVAGSPVLTKVADACSAKTRRPLTDNVIVDVPTESSYDITFTYYISAERESEVANIRNAIEGTGGAVEQYIAWQHAKLGRDINPDELRRLVLNAGAYRVTLTAPIYTEVNDSAVAKKGTVAITYGGIE